ncbi:MAG: tetratricopeptide repeat protein [Oscillospiraceae bacterium]|nr:tetratricopeptide repeat protein [Oscillospiraceae bacterium]
MRLCAGCDIISGMKKIVRFLIMVGVVALFWGAYALFGVRVTDAFNLRAAEQALEAGDLERAAGLFTRALENSPRDEALRIRICGLYRDAGNLTRAEHILFAGLRDVGPSAALYMELCALYVAQDKLYDAVRLLDEIGSPGVSAEINALRPPPPEFSASGGRYEERIGVDVSGEAGALVYVSWAGEIPSVSADLFSETVFLEPGVTLARAVAVDSSGLVSRWADTEYVLENIVDPVAFADSGIERAVRETLGRTGGLLYTSDLWGVTEIWLEDPAVYATLDDLRYFPRLQTLGLTGDHGRCDLSVLPELENLTVLSLRSFGVDALDLEIIGQCAGLEQLFLPDNKIGSVSPLETLERLTVLDLSTNYILDVTPLGRLRMLEELRLTQNAVQGVAGLAPLTRLRALYLDENRITSLLGLENLLLLEALDLSFNSGLTSIDETAGLSSLVRLYAPRCQIEELPDMQSLRALEELYLGFNMLNSLDGLRGLAALRVLYCPDNAVASLEPLVDSVSLEILEISRNTVNSVEPLAELPALEILRIEYNALGTLLPLKQSPSLNEVYAHGNNISDPLNSFHGTRLEGNIVW